MIPHSRSHAHSLRGERRTSSSGIQMLAPAVRYGHNSQTVASKPIAARWVARSSGPTA